MHFQVCLLKTGTLDCYGLTFLAEGGSDSGVPDTSEWVHNIVTDSFKLTLTVRRQNCKETLMLLKCTMELWKVIHQMTQFTVVITYCRHRRGPVRNANKRRKLESTSSQLYWPRDETGWQTNSSRAPSKATAPPRASRPAMTAPLACSHPQQHAVLGSCRMLCLRFAHSLCSQRVGRGELVGELGWRWGRWTTNTLMAAACYALFHWEQREKR